MNDRTDKKRSQGLPGGLAPILVALAMVAGCSGGSGGDIPVPPEERPTPSFVGYFGGRTLTTFGNNLFSAVGDLDGDGLPDLVICQGGAVQGSLAVFLARGPGQYGDAVTLDGPEGSFCYVPVVADFDEDGFLDIAASDIENNGVIVFANSGDGTFGAAASLPGVRAPVGLVVGDFDSDQHLDLATSNNGDNTVGIFRGHGDGTFSAPTLYADGLSRTFLLAAGDVDGDGSEDLAVTDQAAPRVAILNNDGQGGFGTPVPRVTFPGASSPRASNLAPLDLVRRLAAFGGKNGPTLQDIVDLPGGCASVAIRDLDGDGHPDVAASILQATATPTVGGVGVALNSGDGTFSAGTLYPTTGSFDIGLAAGDFDGDGLVDLATTTVSTNAISILRGDGTGAFTETGVHVAGLAPFGLLAADLDLDGICDLLVNNNLLNSSTILRGLGGGDFESTPGYDPALESEVQVLASGDVDGDGLDDLVVGGLEEPVAVVMLNDGAGSFSASPPMNPGETVNSMALGDLDGDGLPDLVASGPSNRDLLVMLNDGSGSFGAPNSYTMGGSSPNHLALADFDGDGNLDAAVTAPSAESVALFPGTGDGTLDPFVPYAAGVKSAFLTVGDFDQDGHPDLAVTDATSQRLAVLRNDGTGAFGTPTLVDSPVVIAGLANGDFDDDGYPELAAAGRQVTLPGTPGAMVLYQNQGDGTFVAGAATPVGLQPTDVKTADLDRDGHVDLAILDVYTSWYLGWGDGTGGFSSVSAYNSGPAPHQGALGNFNGDRVVDLASSNVSASLFGKGTAPLIYVLNSVLR